MSTQIFQTDVAAWKKFLRLSKRINLDAIALTDHDTHVGWKSAHKCVEKYGVGLSRAEISTGMNEIYHLLAYLYDEKDPKLQSLYDQSKRTLYTFHEKWYKY